MGFQVSVRRFNLNGKKDRYLKISIQLLVLLAYVLVVLGGQATGQRSSMASKILSGNVEQPLLRINKTLVMGEEIVCNGTPVNWGMHIDIGYTDWTSLSDVVVLDTLSPEFELITARASKGSVTVTDGNINWSIGGMAVGETQDLDMLVSATLDPGTYTLNSGATGEGYHEVLNETVSAGPTEPVYVIATPDPVIFIYTDKTTYSAGDVMKTGLNIRNPCDARDVGIYIWVDKPDGSKYWVVQKPLVTLLGGLSYENPTWKSITLPAIPPGNYAWHAVILEPVSNKKISESIAPWTFSGKAAKTSGMKAFEKKLKRNSKDIDSLE